MIKVIQVEVHTDNAVTRKSFDILYLSWVSLNRLQDLQPAKESAY
jgi:hypothetical protein